jgi:hypothetical protein
MEQMKWKRENKGTAAAAAAGPGPPPPAPGPAPPAAPGPAPAAAAAAVEVDMSAMPEGLSKMEQMKVRLCAIHPSIGSPRPPAILPACLHTHTHTLHVPLHSRSGCVVFVLSPDCCGVCVLRSRATGDAVEARSESEGGWQLRSGGSTVGVG